jgi:NADPH-ferrihemoprotein reductase
MNPSIVAIFVMATYGEGEPTDNARHFFEWLKVSSFAKEAFKGLRFTVFGLGDKSYGNYNSVARYLDSRLYSFGASRIFRKGEGDDNGYLEEHFVQWKNDMWPILRAKFGILDNTSIRES